MAEFCEAKVNQKATSTQSCNGIISLNEMDESSIFSRIPDDLLQQVLSFTPPRFNPAKSVNKRWYKLCNKNEANYYSKLLESLNKNCSAYNKQINDTWIFHPNVRRLSEVERNLGFKGPLHTVEETLVYCKDGDRLLHINLKNPKTESFRHIPIIGFKMSGNHFKLRVNR